MTDSAARPTAGPRAGVAPLKHTPALPLTDDDRAEITEELDTMRNMLRWLDQNPPMHADKRREYIVRTHREIARLEAILWNAE